MEKIISSRYGLGAWYTRMGMGRNMYYKLPTLKLSNGDGSKTPHENKSKKMKKRPRDGRCLCVLKRDFRVVFIGKLTCKSS